MTASTQESQARLKAELEAYAARINPLLPDDRRIVVYDDIENESAYMMIIELKDGECSGEIGYFISNLRTGTFCLYAGAGDYPNIALFGETDEEVASKIATLEF